MEEGKFLSPKFDKQGLIPVVTTDYKKGDVLMMGYMNSVALKKQSKRKKLIIGADQEKQFGTKAKLVATCRKLKILE